MRKLIIYILLLTSFAAHSQVDYFTLTRTNGELMGMVEHVAPNNPNGTRGPVILWLHGVDANVDAQPVNSGDTTRIAVVTNKGPLRNVRGTGATYSIGGSPLPMFRKPGTIDINGLYRYSIVAPQNPQPQCATCDRVWRADVVAKAMEYIRANPQKWDTSCIVLWGYSLGGRGLKTELPKPAILPYVKYAVDIAGGTTAGTTANFQTLAASGVPIDFYFTVNDELVNELETDAFVNGIKAQNPRVVPNYFRLQDIIQTSTTTNPEHDFMEVLIARDTTNGDTETTTNGDTWTKTDITNIYIRGLRFLRPKGMYLFIFVSIYPMNRRRRQNK